MKIPENLPQFKDTPSLLVVSGWQSGKLLYALSGKIESDKELKVPDHKYSDNEGFFQASTGGAPGEMHSGAPLEKKKQHIRKEFLRLFVDYIKNRVNKLDIEEIYLFSPREGLNGLENHLPNEIKEKVESFYIGNYIKHSPEDLVEIIKNQKPKPVEVMSEEARKILDKGK